MFKHGINNRYYNLFLAGIWWAPRAHNSHWIVNEIIPLFKLSLEITNMTQIIVNSINITAMSLETRWVSYHSSRETCHILNIDGSSLGNPRRAWIGGTIRDYDGNWIIGFARYLGIRDNLFVELMALHRGLNLAYHKGIRKLTVYFDSMLAINLTSTPPSKFHRYATTIRNIQNSLSKLWDGQILHTLQEGNCAADSLAKLGADSSSSWHVFRNPPRELQNLLDGDVSRTLMARG